MKVVLYHPQIPHNTGNIVRTCSVTGCDLVLVRPLGFKTDDKTLKRAGLDYWEGVNVDIIDDLVQYLASQTSPFYFLSSHATAVYTEVSYPKDAILIFGSEIAGLPPFFKETWGDQFVTIPMKEGSRCLNLSNAVAITIYEAQRQNFFRDCRESQFLRKNHRRFCDFSKTEKST